MDLPNIQIKRILFATDLSETARHAFVYAASMADHYTAQIIILHVLQEVPEKLDQLVTGYIGAQKWEKIKASHYDEAREALIGKQRVHEMIRQALNQFCETAAADMQTPPVASDQILIVRGNPVKQILQTAKENDCDLIVMGQTGHQSFTEAFMGSTAKRVLSQTSIPVFIVPSRQ